MKVRLLAVAGVLIAVLALSGCAPAKAPSSAATVPAEYRSLRLVGASIASESTTALTTLVAVLTRFYPEIEWSSVSGTTGVNIVQITKGAVKLGMVTAGNYIDTYGYDKIAESRVKSINVPRGLTSYFFIIPDDKPWKDITEVPRGANFSPGTPGSTQPMLSEAWLKVAGLGKKDFNWLPLGKAEMPDAWRAGKLDVSLVTVSGMSPYLMDLFTGPRKFKPMGLSPEQVARANAEQAFERIGFLSPTTAPLTRMVPEVFKYDVVSPQLTVALSARDDFPEDIAYKMAKTLDEHYADLVQINPPLKFGSTPQFHIQVARPPLDIHPGVAKYYREKGYLK